MSNWRSWGDVNRTHVSERDKQQRILDGFIMADYAVAHLIKEMRSAGLPGITSITPPHATPNQTHSGWQYASSVSVSKPNITDQYELAIAESGRFWTISQSVTSAVRAFNGTSFEFVDTDWTETVLDDKNLERICRLFGPLLTPFQLLMVELLRIYNLPMPPDQQPIR